MTVAAEHLRYLAWRTGSRWFYPVAAGQAMRLLLRIWAIGRSRTVGSRADCECLCIRPSKRMNNPLKSP